MRYGICCPLERIPLALRVGFEYIEFGASSFERLDAEGRLRELKGLPIEATNLFFPGRLKLFGPEKSPWEGYARRTVETAASIGVKVMVIGSGTSRNAPEGVDPDQAELEFCAVAGQIQHYAEPLGITIAPEPLNRTETNVGNDLGRFARRLQAEGVAFTPDTHHILYEWDANGRPALPPPLTGGGQGAGDAPSAEYLAYEIPVCPGHVHFGDLPRACPSPDDPMLHAISARFRDVGYSGRISLEYGAKDPAEEWPRALDAMKRIFG